MSHRTKFSVSDIVDLPNAPAVQDLAALRAIPAANRADKQTRWVEDLKLIYGFDATGTGTDDGDAIIAPTAGTGRWFKMAGSGGVALGETSSTAYRGDRGKTAYDHSQITSGNPHGTTASDVEAEPELGNPDSDGQILSSTTDGVRSWIDAPEGGGSGSELIAKHYADAGNTGTAETDLYSDSIAASVFAANGDALVAEYGLTLVNSTSSKQVRAYFGGNLIFDTGALSISASGELALRLLLVRESSSVVRVEASATMTGASTGAYANVVRITGLTLSGSNILKITGTAAGLGAASNDIVATVGIVGQPSVPGPQGAPGTGGSTYSGCRAYHAGNIHIDGGWVSIPVDAEEYDTDNYHSTSSNPERMTIPATGYYDLLVSAVWLNNEDNAHYMRFLKNGTDTIARAVAASSASHAHEQQLVALGVHFTAGDYVVWQANTTSSNNYLEYDADSIVWSPVFVIKKC